MKIAVKKYMPAIIRLSGFMMAFAFVAVTIAQNSTCICLYHQPKVPESLLESDDE